MSFNRIIQDILLYQKKYDENKMIYFQPASLQALSCNVLNNNIPLLHYLQNKYKISEYTIFSLIKWLNFSVYKNIIICSKELMAYYYQFIRSFQIYLNSEE